MDEYRLAFEFWGSLGLATVVVPLTIAAFRQLAGAVRHVRDESRSAPLASVPSTPGV
jgi:hypothetical protein